MYMYIYIYIYMYIYTHTYIYISEHHQNAQNDENSSAIKQLLCSLPCISSLHCTHVITCVRFCLKQMLGLTKAMVEMKCEH